MGPRYQGEVEFLVRDLGQRRPWPGALLVRQSGGAEIVVHRLLLSVRRHGKRRWYLKGDGNTAVDPSIVPGEETVGEAIAVRVNGRERSLTSPWARTLGLLRAMGGLLMSVARKLRHGTTRPLPPSAPTGAGE